jgi:hypothetical protein
VTRKIQFVASDDSFHQVNADQWKKVLAIDPGATFGEAPCDCCKSTLVFTWTHCPACGGLRKQAVNRLPSWDCFCLECWHLYSIRDETKRYEGLF